MRLDLSAFLPTDDRRRLPTGETILTAGGRFDNTFGRFLDPAIEADADTIAIVGLEESQLEVARFGAEWIRDYRDDIPRDTTVAMLAGDRRGGKTFVGVALVISCCIDAPIAIDGTPLIAWIVCKSFRERFELEQWILNRIPPDWYRHLGAPVHEFRFAHGPTLRLISADDDDATKQGRVDICFINEPQKMGPRAVANAVLGASDLGGLVLLAANPPGSHTHGEWMFDLKDALDDERILRAQGKSIEELGVRYFHLDSKQNRSIDQLARRRAGRVAGLIDPTIKAGDIEGEWRRPGELAAWEFDKHRHLRPPPAVGMLDITREVASDQSYGEWVAVGGIDFQNRPHIIAAIARIYGDPDDPTVWFVGECIGERRQSEEQFLERFLDYAEPRGWTRQNFLWIGDASSSWQGPKHDFENNERDSFSVFRGDDWEIIPSQEPRPGSRTGRGRNPDVSDRLQLTNERLRRDRIFIDPEACPWVAECFQKASTKRVDARRRLVGRHAHGFDAATYLIWRLTSKLNQASASPDDARFVTPRRPKTW